MQERRRYLLITMVLSVSLIAISFIFLAAGCGGEDDPDDSGASSSIGAPVEAAAVAAGCQEPAACEQAVRFHNLILAGDHLGAFDLIYYDPDNNLAMEKQQRLRDTWEETLEDYYRISEAGISGFEVTREETDSSGDHKVRYKATATLADGSEKKVDVSLTMEKRDGEWVIIGWGMMH